MKSAMSHSECQTTACVILARGGSKGVPGKNLRHVGGVSLVARAVRAARMARQVGCVYVSTDDAAIATEARLYGARIIDRPAALASDTASSESGWLHALSHLRRDMPDLSRLVFLQCTSPFTTGADIDHCLKSMQDKGADCALSVIADHSFLWSQDADGWGQGVNHTPAHPRRRRQDLPPAFRESGAIYCVKADAFEAAGQRFCGTVALCPVDHPPIEIDSERDLQICALLLQQMGRVGVDPARLRGLRAVVMDFDGVHTDNRVQVDETGQETVRSSRYDGLGLSMMRDAGHWRMLILSKERNPVVARRAEKLTIPALHGIDDKLTALDAWLSVEGLTRQEVLYVGNDVNDKAVMQAVGLSACPSDSHPEIMAIADWILPFPGGAGALRAMADALLAHMGRQ
ncbi:acylneuraminate cytidylyltransferase [Roseovarius litoreus]|nr:acylneuraminate cytidylyltransferase [Roseovarius litoreus]